MPSTSSSSPSSRASPYRAPGGDAVTLKTLHPGDDHSLLHLGRFYLFQQLLSLGDQPAGGLVALGLALAVEALQPELNNLQHLLALLDAALLPEEPHIHQPPAQGAR
jgi:hypothetical protein